MPRSTKTESDSMRVAKPRHHFLNRRSAMKSSSYRKLPSRLLIIIAAIIVLMALVFAPGLLVRSSQAETEGAQQNPQQESSTSEEKEGNPQDRARYWEMRRGISPRARLLMPGKTLNACLRPRAFRDERLREALKREPSSYKQSHRAALRGYLLVRRR